ncbi:hypothetical protein GBAR_LOCUS23931 [Geodia barretti]|uniref:Secreted protein n=1 Tax=Geodia barretti TaxID=519541 RepID=A0AA35T8C2_GEOBA|nr:hypothetical protein GBAR_LOCUS23931 [Geodia barretti]
MSWWSPCYQDCTLILCLSLETRVSVCSPAALLMPRATPSLSLLLTPKDCQRYPLITTSPTSTPTSTTTFSCTSLPI